MPEFESVVRKFFPFKKLPPIDKYHVSVVTAAEELEFGEILPIEIRYVLAVRPIRHEMFRKLLEAGFGIGVRTVDKTPERVLIAVDRISRRSQHNTILPWLEELLRNETSPVFSEEDLQAAEEIGVNLTEEVGIILSQRGEFKKIVLVPLHNQLVTEQEQRLMLEVNEDLYPHAIDVILHRVTFDNAHTRTEVAQSIIKALIVIGPVAHLLEHALSGLGKIFAATADDLLSEAAEVFALRGSGFTWRQLIRRSRILVVVFAAATYGAFQVEPLIQSGHIAFAGVVFGLSAVALSLTTAIQSIGMYRQAFVHLVRDGKLRLVSGDSVTRLALHQDFTNPARLGLFIGAIASPIVAAFIFVFFPQLTSNGWILATLGSVESLVAGITVISANRISRALFRMRVRKILQKIVSGSPLQGSSGR